MIEFLIRGGYSMIPIILCSVLAGAVIIERGLSLRSRKVLPPALKTNPERFRAPDEDFSRILKEHPSPLSDVLAACYQNRGRDREKNLGSLQVVEKKAAGGREMEEVVLSVTRNGNIFLNQAPVTREELMDKLRGAVKNSGEQTLILRADREVSYGLIVELMDISRQAGLTKIVALTAPAE
jgi:hypothetical protein